MNKEVLIYQNIENFLNKINRLEQKNHIYLLVNEEIKHRSPYINEIYNIIESKNKITEIS